MNDFIVVKVGGALLQNPAAAVRQIVERDACGGGNGLAVVHGGGVQITRMLEKMNVQSQFIDGLRVTDEVALQAVAAALLGEVHTALVAAMQKAGLPAVGVFGAVKAEKKVGPWGLVGTHVHVDGKLLGNLIRDGRIPVVPTIAVGESSLLNVNGDETAAAVAVALSARKLAFLTDVEGVLDETGKVIERVPYDVSLLGASFVSGGMKPKLLAVQAALTGGVDAVEVGKTQFESKSGGRP